MLYARLKTIMEIKMNKTLRLTGIFAFFLFFIVAAVSISFNPWFEFNKNAFSSLGSYGANYLWIYNIGMMAIGALIIAYAITFILDSKNKMETIGGAFIIIAGIFLIFVGIYHDGTKPHNLVSAYFFGQAEAALIVCGIGLILAEERKVGWIIIAFSIGALLFAILHSWPSAAAVEEYGIFTIGVRIILLSRI